MDPSVWLSASVVLGVAAAWGSSAQLDFRQGPISNLQPRGGAFAIWLVIFTLQLVAAVLLQHVAWSARAVVALVASLALCTVWTKVWPHRAAGYVLLAAAAVAWTSLAWSAHPLPRAATGIYAGWLTVATVLNLVPVAPPWVLPLVATAAASGSVALGKYEPLLAVTWAVLLQRPLAEGGQSLLSVGTALTACVLGIVFSTGVRRP